MNVKDPPPPQQREVQLPDAERIGRLALGAVLVIVRVLVLE